MRDHGSIGLALGMGSFGGKFGFECFCLFLFCFCLVRGEKVASAQDFGWQSKGEGHFGSWFSFFFVYLVTILYCSDIVWSEDLSAYFFCFLPILDREFSFLPFFFSFIGIFFLFCVFSLSWIGNFPSLCVFFRSLIENFPFSLFFFFAFSHSIMGIMWGHPLYPRPLAKS